MGYVGMGFMGVVREDIPEAAVDDEEDGDEEGGDSRWVHDGVRPATVPTISVN